ncbi:MAG: hypothetical protein HQ536_03140 [Parcubacteria group bacterium]|nr:hypothetical protein [Parcubacteria group bacterium]
MNTRKLKKIFLIVGGVLILLAIALIILTRQTPEPEEKVEAPIVMAPEEKTPQLPPVSKEDQDKNNLLIKAASFVERFGSYSNQGNFENVKDLFPFMTPSLKVWADRYIEEQTIERPDPSNYYGMTTKAISYELSEFNDSTGYAKVLVSTQKREATGSMENEEIYYQDAEIEFNKIGDEWKIDGVWWQ